jgi:probable HAF family extracellular repeat protein
MAIQGVLARTIGLTLILSTGAFQRVSDASPAYSILDLGLPNRNADAGAINNNGQAVFYSDPEGYPFTSNTVKGNAYEFDGTSPIVQNGLGAATNAISDINNHDHAVGWADDTSGNFFAVKYENGIATSLGIPNALADAINDADQVTGWLYQQGSQTAYLYDPNSGITNLGTLGGGLSLGYGINNQGVVVGSSDTGATDAQIAAGTPVTEAFEYRNGIMTGLGTLGGTASGASAINDQNAIVGNSLTASGEYHAFLYDAAHGMQDLGTAGLQSNAFDINNLGQIVGESERVGGSGEYHAFLYDPNHGVRFLEDLIPTNSDWQRLLSGVSINDRGQILGEGFIDGQRHVFLMTPVPEPSASVTIFVATLAYVSKRRRDSTQSAR